MNYYTSIAEATRAQKQAERKRFENLLLSQIQALKLPEPKREFLFHYKRKWRFDFAYPDLKLAIEVNGGAFSRGRHTRGKGYEDDCEKLAEAAILGWRVISVTTGQVERGEAINWIERYLKGCEA